MEADLYIHNGLIVTESGTFAGSLAIKDGKISQINYGEAPLKAAEVIDLQGRVLFPGVVDEHAHFSEIGREYEGYIHGTSAAAAGGVTTALEMPLNDLPPVVDATKLLHKRNVVQDKAIVDYAHWGGLIDNNVDCLEEMHQEGVVGFKAFYSYVSDFPRVNDDLLYAGLVKMKQLGNVVGLHAENEYLVSYLRRQLQAQGRKDREAWIESRPISEELDAIQRAIYWSGVSGGRLHILHVSIPEGMRAVARAKLQRIPVSVETCVHYLFFDSSDHLRLGSYCKAAPPIRERAQVEDLWDCVGRGLVDCIASDHSPFPAADQAKGQTDVWEGGGITGIQSILPAMITEAVHKRRLGWSLLARLMSANPARIFGLYPTKGAMLPGSDADLVIIDPDKEWTLQGEELYSRYRHSPYIGYTYKGRVDQTIVRGTTVYRSNEITVEPGFGRVYRRQYSA